MTYSVNNARNTWVTSQGIALEDFLVLTLHVLQKSREEFFREADHELTEDQYTELTHLLERRLKHEPVAYLLGSKEFYGRNFFVNEHTLIPRPETECLVEDVLTNYSEAVQKPDTLLDIGTGSGILAITLAKELKNTPFQVFASDISHEALIVAQKNADSHAVNVQFLKGSLLEPYKRVLHAKNVYLIANLPYVSETLLQEAELDVKDYEPRTALFSENEGLAHYQELIKQIKGSTLTGTAWLEISPEQSQILATDIKNTFPETQIFIGQDLSQRDRFIRFTF